LISIAYGLALAVAGSGIDNSSAATDEQSLAATAFAACLKREAAGLDDGVSGADVIATAVVGGCSAQIATLETLLKRRSIAIARSNEGLKEREQNELASKLLAQVPEQMRDLANRTALRAVLMQRTKKNNASNN
jgi:hypothetical protein